MEPQRKVRRTRGKASSSSPKSSIIAIDDRISNLPDPIIHDIFDLLPTKSVAMTSMLSTRFNFLRWSYPIIDLNEFHLHDRKIRSRFLNRMKTCRNNHDFTFLEKLKIRTREATNNKKEIKRNMSSLVDTFIFKASSAKTLKEINLQFHIPKIRNIPTIQDISSHLDNFPLLFYILPEKPLFSFCKSLKILKLRGCRFEDDVFMNEDGIIFPSLNELHIKYCLIPHANFVSKLLDGCPKLEKFAYKFNFPRNKIQFSSSSIKHLIMASYCDSMTPQVVAPNLKTYKICGTNWRTNDYGVSFINSHIQIFAPNLETLYVKDSCVPNDDNRRANAKFKNLKEFIFDNVFFVDEPKFVGEKLERLTISKSTFHYNYIIICPTYVPLLKNVSIHGCTGMRKVDLETRSLHYKLQGCTDFKNFYEIFFD